MPDDLYSGMALGAVLATLFWLVAANVALLVGSWVAGLPCWWHDFRSRRRRKGGAPEQGPPPVETPTPAPKSMSSLTMMPGEFEPMPEETA